MVFRVLPWAAAAILWSLAPAAAASSITFDGAATNQVIDGFGVNANHRSWNNDELKPVLDALIDRAGMTLFRVVYDEANWESTNDNADSTVMNWTYYNSVYSSAEFTKLWDLIAYLNGRGITNGVSLSIMGRGPQWLGWVALTNGMEDEWAEMIASLLVYARNTARVRFAFIEPNNEPDTTNEGITMSSATYVTALHQLAAKLDANGLSDMRFIAPDLAGGGSNYMPQMVADPVVMAKLGHFGVHSYSDAGGGSAGVYSYIQSTSYRDRTFWMTEFNDWCSTCDSGTRGTYDWTYCKATASYLLNHLLNNASAGLVWEGYDSFYLHPPSTWSFWGLFAVDDTNAVVKTYTPRKNFYTLAQISKWVRPGAQRISVSGSTSPFSPLLAFNHAGLGQFTIVGINTSTSPAALSGTNASLPALLSLNLYYTSATTNLAYGGSVAVTNRKFSATIPADCVFTLTGLAGVNAAITNPVSGARFNGPAAIPIAANAASADGAIEEVAFYNGQIKLGETSAPPYTFLWTNVPMGDYSLTVSATDVAGNARTSAVVNVDVVGALAQVLLAPASAAVAVGDTAQFTATGSDTLGHPLDPQPAFSWSVSRGGTMDGSGRFTAGDFVGGPFQVVANNGGLCATAAVSVVVSAGGTLGNTNEGALTESLWNRGSRISASRFLAASGMVVSTVHAKVAALAGRYQCAIYEDSGGSPRVLLAGSIQLTNSTAGWHAFPLLSSVPLAGGQYYWLAIWSDSANGQIYYSDNGGTSQWGQYSYGSWPDPISTFGSGALNCCIFAEGVGQAIPPINWSAPLDIEYGTPLGAAQLSATSAVPGAFAYDPPAGAVLNAGLGQDLWLAFLPHDTNSYAGVISNVSLNVLPKALTITANSTNKVYGAPLPEWTVSYTGFVNGDAPSSLDSPAVVSTTATAGSDAGTYNLIPAGAVSANYSIEYEPGTLVIAPAGTIGLLTSSRNPAAEGTAVSFSYAISPVAPGVGTPTGSVWFKVDGNNMLLTRALASGAPVNDTVVLTPGIHTVEAGYKGSLNFFGTTNELAPPELIVAPPNLLISRLKDGSCLIRTGGIPGETCRIEYADTLINPEWQTLVSGAVDDSGVFEYSVLPPRNSPASFFRAVIALNP
jgi:O-glycosyl hydrolase